LPTMSDYLIAYATSYNHVAYRNEKDGSHFINVLTNVFQRMAKKEQLIDMLTEVNREMADRTFNEGKGKENRKQQPQFVSALRMKLYLHPGELTLFSFT